MIKEQPKEITECKLGCILMPNGEIISLGKTIGWFKDYGNNLEIASKTDSSSSGEGNEA